jgi:hypothetical protein
MTKIGLTGICPWPSEITVAWKSPILKAGADHDRRNALEGASDRRKSFKKGSVPRRIGRKGGLNSKLHAICDGAGRPLVMLLSEDQISDFKGAALVLSALPTCSPTKATTPTGSARRSSNARSPLHPVKIQPESSDSP